MKYGRIFDIKTREWIYNIALAGIMILVGYGVVTQELATLWVALAGAVIGIARVNTGIAGVEPKGDIDE